jgi:hypothetical protein
MGGTGLLIFGTLAPERLAPQPVPRNWLDRLLGRTRTAGPHVHPYGSGSELVSVDPVGLESFIARYRAFLARAIPQPHDASTQVFEYLAIVGIPNLYVRGEPEPGKEPDWYTQLGFSGCAGMAEVSAVVAAHWAGAWLRQELPAIEREVLAPFGFTPRPGQTFDQGDRFLPFEELGYLRWLPETDRDEGGIVFEVDYAIVDGDEDTPARVADASARHAGLMADGRCRCQLCDPGFAPLPSAAG